MWKREGNSPERFVPCAKYKAFKLDDEHNDGFGQCFWGIYFPNWDSSSYHKGTDFYCSEFEAKEQ